MLKHLFILVFFVFQNQFSFSQSQDLMDLAEGKLVHSTLLYDSDSNVYGYIFFYDQGKIDNENKQFEYILLDPNLNKVANGTFTERNINKAHVFFDDCKLVGDDILFTKTVKIKFITMLSYNRIISIKNNEVSEPFYYENNSFKNLDVFSADPIHEKFKKDEYYSLAFPINYQNTKGFFVFDNYKSKVNFNEKSLKLYNVEKEPIWNYEYNKEGTKKSWKEFSILSINDGIILGGLSYRTSSKHIDSYSIVGIDIHTGKELFEYQLENDNSEFSHSVVTRNYKDQIYIVGNFSPYAKRDFDWEKNLGIFRIQLSINGEEISKKYYKWQDFTGDIETNKYGKAEKGFYLTPMRFFIFKDGSFSHLTEKFKDATTLGYGTIKSTDFVLFNFDKSGNSTGYNLIEKDQSKYVKNDYLFHQYIKDKSGVVFFFQDYKKDDETRDKNWILGINTMIDGKFNQETIPISSDDYVIKPVPAKEGYILLREFNEKENFNQLRLERLNY